MSFLYDISSDGRSVWVNTGSCCIARFGRGGIDIHRPMNDQASSGECLFCTHGPTVREHWDLFVQKMKELYSIDVGPEHTPERFCHD